MTVSDQPPERADANVLRDAGDLLLAEPVAEGRHPAGPFAMTACDVSRLGPPAPAARTGENR